LVHRRNEFRGALDSVEKVQELKDAGKIKLITPAEVVGLNGAEHISQSILMKMEHTVLFHVITLFLLVLHQKLGPIGNWGLEIEKMLSK
jgi:thioredoxin reductase (NADPH)